MLLLALCIISKQSVKSNRSYSPETPNSGQNQWFSVPRDLEVWQMTVKNCDCEKKWGTSLLWYFELCASFQSHQGNQTGVTVRKRPIRIKIDDFFVPCDLEIDGCSWITTGHLIYDTASFLHNFKASSEIKRPNENAQFGSKSINFVPCDLEIWQMTL